MTPHAIIRAAAAASMMKGKVRCPNCGHMNPTDAEKCEKCGYPLKGSEKKAGVIRGPITSAHSKQDLEDERSSIQQLLASKRMSEGNLRTTGRFTPRGTAAVMGGVYGLLGALRGATLPAEDSVTGTRLGDAALGGGLAAAGSSAIGWAAGKYGLKNRLAKVEAALAEKRAGFIGDVIGANYRKAHRDAAEEISALKSNVEEALRHADSVANRQAAAHAKAALNAGRVPAHHSAAMADAVQKVENAAKAFNASPFFPETHPKVQEARRRMVKARAGAALGVGALGLGALGAYGLYKATRPKDSSEKEAEVEYHGHTFPGYNIPVKSSRPEKKKMVLAKKGDEVRLIHFGQQGYKHNYSDAAKKNYLARSAGIRGKGGLTKDDKFSANYWARRELWPKNEPADGTAKDRTKSASSEKEERFAHKAELAGLGILAAPYVAHLGTKIPGVRRAALPVSHFLHKNPTAEHLVELGGLGVLATPSIRHLMAKKKSVSDKTAASEDYLLGQIGRAAGNTLQKYPVPTLAGAYAVSKAPAIVKAWKEKKTDESMPVGYAPSVVSGSIVRHGDPQTAKYLARRAFGPV